MVNTPQSINQSYTVFVMIAAPLSINDVKTCRSNEYWGKKQHVFNSYVFDKVQLTDKKENVFKHTNMFYKYIAYNKC